MKPPTAERTDTAAPLEDKLEHLCDALPELPDSGRRSADHQATRILLSIDDIVERVRALAALVEAEGGSGWDLVDHATAQMLLRDLAVIARDLRAVAVTVADDLAVAEGHVRDVNGVLSQLERKITPKMVEPGDAAARPDAP